MPSGPPTAPASEGGVAVPQSSRGTMCASGTASPSRVGVDDVGHGGAAEPHGRLPGLADVDARSLAAVGALDHTFWPSLKKLMGGIVTDPDCERDAASHSRIRGSAMSDDARTRRSSPP